VLVETARLFFALGHHDSDGVWRIDEVTGPDECSALDDDNIYTNLMVARNLGEAADAVDRHPGLARTIDVTRRRRPPGVAPAWRCTLPTTRSQCAFSGSAVHPPLGVGLRRHRGRYPLLLHANYFDLYRKQVVKQADLVLAMYLCGDAFTPDAKPRNFDYYERRTVRDSSLSACTQAVMAAEMGQLELAYNYADEAALIDLQGIHQNSSDGTTHRLPCRRLDRAGRGVRRHA
jgi:alpha,alpha-trehalose phosphorylase